MRRDYTVIALCLLALLCAGQAHAEVRAFTDRDGEYTATRVLLDGRSGRIWSPVRSVVASRGAERRSANFAWWRLAAAPPRHSFPLSTCARLCCVIFQPDNTAMFFNHFSDDCQA